MEIFCQDSTDTSNHILKILRHGWLPRSSDYYIDMEFCGGTLEEWILSNKATYSAVKNTSEDYQKPYSLYECYYEHVLEEGLNIMIHILDGLTMISQT